MKVNELNKNIDYAEELINSVENKEGLTLYKGKGMMKPYFIETY